jgi:hypothetical protein
MKYCTDEQYSLCWRLLLGSTCIMMSAETMQKMLLLQLTSIAVRMWYVVIASQQTHFCGFTYGQILRRTTYCTLSHDTTSINFLTPTPTE